MAVGVLESADTPSRDGFVSGALFRAAFTVAFLTFLGLYAQTGRTAAFICAGAIFAAMYLGAGLAAAGADRREAPADAELVNIAVMAAALVDATASDAELMRRVERARRLAATLRAATSGDAPPARPRA